MVMPSVQIISNCPSLKDFTTFAYNTYEKVKPLVHDAVIHKFAFNARCEPKYVTKKQVQFPLVIFSIVHSEAGCPMTSRYFITWHKLMGKPFQWVVHCFQFN